MIEVLVALSLSMVTSYHIGNSLMNDGLGNYDPATGNAQTATYGVEAIARGQGFDYQMAMHIDSSRPMHVIWENPAGVEFNGFRPAYGRWDNALANFQWDHVLFEPYLGEDNTLGIDKEMINNFIDYTRSNPANSDTIFYVYQAWPRQSWGAAVGGYTNYWLSGPNPTDQTLTRPRLSHYDFLMDWAQETYTPQGILVREIPNGEVWNRVYLAIQSGEITEISSMESLYRDDLHGSYMVGRYLAAATNYSVMFQTSPVGLTPPASHYGAQYPQSLYDKLNRMIWEVVSSDSHTGIADFNDDGHVSQADLALFQTSYGLSAAADADGDGDTDGQDLLTWQRSLRVPPALPEKVTSYHIGNALMNDGLGNFSNGNAKTGIYGLEAMARGQGHDYQMAMHIDNSRPMHVIWEDPAGVEFNGYRDSFGSWDVALAEHEWDHVMIEPYQGAGNTLGIDKEMIGSFINYTRSNPENSDTIFYVYQVWPRQSWTNAAGGYDDYWLANPNPNDDTLTAPRRSHYDFLMDWAQETYGSQGIVVREIPNGEVWNQVILAIESGEITEIFSMSDLYRDDQLASTQIGRYLAAATNYAVMFQTNPAGMVPPSPQFSLTYPQSLYDKLNQIIWEVVTSDPHTGITNGFNSLGDYPFSGATVPEPSTALLFSAALLFSSFRRMRG